MELNNTKFMACFIIALVIGIPFYSSNALAVTVSVVSNSGSDGFEGFLNGHGDVWQVQAAISDITQDVTVENMRINLGGRADVFDTCNSNDLGFTCEYISDLSAGVPEDSYSFDVAHIPSGAGDGDVIAVDSSAPQVKDISLIQQPDGQLLLDFTVLEKPAFGVGLAKIDITDADTNAILQTITEFSERELEYNYATEHSSSGIFNPPGYLVGQGEKKIKIRAEDKFGHFSVVGPFRFDIDYVAPSIIDNSLYFKDLGDFMGVSSVLTTMEVNVTETDTFEITASSSQVEFLNPNGVCTEKEDEIIGKYWNCKWDPVQVSPSENVVVQFRAQDPFGNVLETSLTKRFALDTSPPQVNFFGTSRTYEENSYISRHVPATIVLEINEVGAGMDENGIVANFADIGVSGDKTPTDCDAAVTRCNWSLNDGEIDVSGGLATISLVRFFDKMGNEGPHLSRDLIVDNAAPHVHRLEILGLSGEREKVYYESGDKLLFRMNVSEVRSGLFFKVDLNDVVMGAKTAYPATKLAPAGWEVFTQESCIEYGDDWECEFVTREELKSGHQSAAKIKLVLSDTPGNEFENWDDPQQGAAEKSSGEGEYKFEKLAVDDEASPDYWSFKSATTDDFIDMDITPYISTRISLNVVLEADDSNVGLLEVALESCESDLEPGRHVVWNNVHLEPDRSPSHFNLIMEFPPFDSKEHFENEFVGEAFRKAMLDVSCGFRIYSAKNDKALLFSEVEVAEFQVPFGFTQLGEKDAALAVNIAEAKKEVTTGFFGFMGDLNDVMKVVNYILKALELILSIVEIYNAVEIIVGATAQGVSTIPIPLVKDTGTTARISFCLGGQLFVQGTNEIVSVIQKPVEIFSCKRTVCDLADDVFGDDWYYAFTCALVGIYNAASEGVAQGLLDGENPFSTFGETISSDEFIPPATGVRDNIYLSAASLCVPGVIHNLEKLRQIKCRKIHCLQNEVPQGIATVQSCEKLYDVLQCKYVTGPLYNLIPGFALLANLWGALESLLTDPFAWVTTSIYLGCSIHCLYPSGKDAVSAVLHTGCANTYVVIKVLKIINDGIQAGQQLAQDLEAGGSDYCSLVLADEDTGPSTALSQEELQAAARAEAAGEGGSAPEVATEPVESADEEVEE
jgi:hypothetical protein